MEIAFFSIDRGMLAELPLFACSASSIGKQRLGSRGRQKLVRVARKVRLLLPQQSEHLHLHLRYSIRPAIVRLWFNPER